MCIPEGPPPTMMIRCSKPLNFKLSGSKLAFGFGSICGNKDFSGFSAMAG